MNTTPQEGAAAQAQEAAPVTVNIQYIKDLSFEMPNTPSIFGELAEKQPDININVGVGAQPLTDTMFEVALQINVECKVGDQVGFLLELIYTGIFTVNVPQEALQAMLLIECPRLLFPFARNIVADMSRDGGFPPLMMTPIDFVALYQQRMAEAAEEAGVTGTA